MAGDMDSHAEALGATERAVVLLADACDQQPSDRLIWDRIEIDEAYSYFASRGRAGGVDRVFSGTATWTVHVSFMTVGQDRSHIKASAGSLVVAVDRAIALIDKRHDAAQANGRTPA